MRCEGHYPQEREGLRLLEGTQRPREQREIRPDSSDTFQVAFKGQKHRREGKRPPASFAHTLATSCQQLGDSKPRWAETQASDSPGSEGPFGSGAP